MINIVRIIVNNFNWKNIFVLDNNDWNMFGYMFCGFDGFIFIKIRD